MVFPYGKAMERLGETVFLCKNGSKQPGGGFDPFSYAF